MNRSPTTSHTHGPRTYTDARSRRRRQAPVAVTKLNGFTIDKLNRFWQVIDPEGQLVCMTVYKCGAKEVVRRLTA